MMEAATATTTTRERAEALAEALSDFPHAMGSTISADDLLDWLGVELGHTEILDGLRPRGSILSKANPPRSILHVVAGNTPNAAIQSLALGVLLGSHNLLKLPSAAPEVSDAVRRFIAALPLALRESVECASDLPDAWLLSAGAVIVYGSDETVADFRGRLRSWQKFIAHGHRLSFAIVFNATASGVAEAAARDVSLFDQQGCLSPHTIYVAEAASSGGGEARAFAEQLAAAMAEFNVHTPRRPIGAGPAQEIQHLRSSYAFRAANDPRVGLWQSERSTDWTVIYEEDPQFAVSCLNRLVFVKPLPPLESMPEHLRLVRPHLSSVAISPCTEAHARSLLTLGVSRMCALGQSQVPTPFWHQDGLGALALLVDWIDLEGVPLPADSID
ncbi:MAG: hypothetical protein O3C21_05255 [Verrucomicrobia bacterium]|nr:hypothetical protein [Verrucomicrobiota bacterium]